MKTIVVVVALCIVGAMALTEEQEAQLGEFKTVCMEESNVERQVVEDLKKGIVDENNEKGACFVACMLKKMGIMNQDGSLNEEVVKKRAPTDVTKERVEEIFNKCKDITGTNDCNKAAKLVACYKKNKSLNLLD
ncbi:general odorant-binding protein 56h-like [Colletes gigas]|uniref:general odorant-binding protein 56h-like n=1 Tax=Colletes gigas TaxID=935657 RepID=UPI001C9A586B|nr:general odorant-binding protein 56h-like [Colletes gigas]